MSTTSYTKTTPHVKVKFVHIEYDRTDPQQVLEVINGFYPEMSAKDFTPELVGPFIPEGADPGPLGWLKTLKNAEYVRNHPEKQKRPSRSRSKTGTHNRKHNPAAAVIQRDLVAH